MAAAAAHLACSEIEIASAASGARPGGIAKMAAWRGGVSGSESA